MLISYHQEQTATARGWYQESAPALQPLPTLSDSITTDIAIIGAGYTGVSAALDLAARGYQVVVLEAQSVGWGASGRNGGQIIGGFARDITGLVGADDARSLALIAADAMNLIRARIDQHQIECDLRWGYICAAEKKRQIAECQTIAELTADGVFLDRAAMAERLGTDYYLAGCYDPKSGHLHPLKYARGLAQAALGLGVQIYEQSPVVALEQGAQEHVMLKTLHGQITARHVILAGNALLHGIAPQIAPYIMPVGTHIIATEPMPESWAHTILRDQPAVCDLNFVLNYFRKTPDHRLLFGGRVSYSGFEMPHVTALIRQKMVTIFPQLASVGISHSWGGLIDISMNRLPHLGKIGKNIWFAQGFSGHGVVLTGVAGRILAEAIDGQMARFDVMARIPHHPFPGGRLLRKPALVLAMMWYRLRDLI